MVSEVGRIRFYGPVVFLCVISCWISPTAIAQQGISSSGDTALPDAPAPVQIPSFATEDPQQATAASITGTILDTNQHVLQGARVMVTGDRLLPSEVPKLTTTDSSRL